MDRTVYHVNHRPNHVWEARREGRFPPDVLGPSQAEVIEQAERLIRHSNARLVIHRPDGKVQEQRWYVATPRGSDLLKRSGEQQGDQDKNFKDAEDPLAP